MTEDAQAATATQQPQIKLLSQYVRDLSFENPAAGRTLNAKPDIQINVNVNARKAEEPTALTFEVSLQLKATASVDGGPAFVAEVDYAGIFQLDGAPENLVHAILLIECPRLLFPFARRVMADVSRDGGYPPLMLDPIDFATLYKRQMEQQRASARPAPPQTLM